MSTLLSKPGLGSGLGGGYGRVGRVGRVGRYLCAVVVGRLAVQAAVLVSTPPAVVLKQIQHARHLVRVRASGIAAVIQTGLILNKRNDRINIKTTEREQKVL